MEIRNATQADMPEILSVYERARAFMRESGNPDQWRNRDPAPEVIAEDIADGNLYVIVDEDGIEGVFAFIPHEDYGAIDGAWLSDEPSCAVHRVASAGKKRGILKTVMDYAFSRARNIKIDTHHDNRVMQHQLEKYGFLRCGVIYLENGDPRLAYQMVID